MDGIITAVGTVITGYTAWFGSISTMLIGNDLVKLLIALGIIGLLIGVVMGLVAKLRGRKKRRR
jgi:hypothetical protein